MALGISAALAGVLTPQAVQLVVTGMTDGEAYEVTGAWSGGTWAIRGGTGTVSGTQIVLADTLAPINVPVTYTVVHDGGTATSSPVTVTYAAGAGVVSALDGSNPVRFYPLKPTNFDETPRLRVAQYAIPGRSTPATRHDIADGWDGSWTLLTQTTATTTMRTLIRSGVPVVVRTDGASFGDSEAVVIAAITSAPSGLVGTEYRVWSVGYTRIADPEPSTVVPIATWDDFDAYHAADEWSDFDTAWTAAEWNDFDAFDWTSP